MEDTVFLPDYYEFCSRAKTIAGHDAIEKISASLRDLGARRPLIISDSGVAGAGLLDYVLNSLESDIEVGGIIDFVPPDSEVGVVTEISRIYREKGCDSIIAVGGGSPIDTAKGVNILVSLGGDDLLAYSGAGKVTRKLNPFIAVPTTSGTGSEMTLVAVIADHANHVKLAFTSYFLLPDVAILDSRMTKTLPPALTAATAMDALTHACEAYICMSKNPLSDTSALRAIRLISENILNVVKNPLDLEGRLALANGSALAGIAFSNSMVGMVHNIGHAIGGACGVPHGTCMSILLPYGLEYNLHRVEPMIAELLFPLAGELEYRSTPRGRRALRTIEYIRDLNQDLHDLTGGRHPRFLNEVVDRDGRRMISRGDFDAIIRNAMDDPAQFYNPEELDRDEYRMVLECAFEGVPIDRSKIKGAGEYKIRKCG